MTSLPCQSCQALGISLCSVSTVSLKTLPRVRETLTVSASSPPSLQLRKRTRYPLSCSRKSFAKPALTRSGSDRASTATGVRYAPPLISTVTGSALDSTLRIGP